jgi:hypothetical protein
MADIEKLGGMGEDEEEDDEWLKWISLNKKH